MRTKLISYPNSLGNALKRGAHLSFCSQNAFVIAAIRFKLAALDDEEINTQLADYEAQVTPSEYADPCFNEK